MKRKNKKAIFSAHSRTVILSFFTLSNDVKIYSPKVDPKSHTPHHSLVIPDFQNEYHSLQIKPNPDCHDRLIVLDYGEETELVYHCGASSKDAGKKLCAINQITETAIIHPVIDRLLLLPDKQI